jgi:hypothetical protein
MSAQVVNKTRPIFLHWEINVYLIVLLIQDLINADPGIPGWHWLAMNDAVSSWKCLSDRHLVFCPLLTDVQPDINRSSDVVHRMRSIDLFFVKHRG